MVDRISLVPKWNQPVSFQDYQVYLACWILVVAIYGTSIPNKPRFSKFWPFGLTILFLSLMIMVNASSSIGKPIIVYYLFQLPSDINVNITVKSSPCWLMTFGYILGLGGIAVFVCIRLLHLAVETQYAKYALHIQIYSQRMLH